MEYDKINNNYRTVKSLQSRQNINNVPFQNVYTCIPLSILKHNDLVCLTLNIVVMYPINDKIIIYHLFIIYCICLVGWLTVNI